MVFPQEIRKRIFCGLDLGQSHDPTVLAVVEQRETYDIVGPVQAFPNAIRFLDWMYVLRQLKRFPLKTPYPEIVSTVSGIFRSPALSSSVLLRETTGAERPVPYKRRIGGPVLTVDATGVGKASFDFLKSAQLNPIGIILTVGETIHPLAGCIGVPKRDVVDSLRMLISTEKFRAVKMPLYPYFRHELENFRMSISPTGRDTYAAASGHDDLVLAVAIACWYAESQTKKTPTSPAQEYRNIAFDLYTR